MIATVPRFNAGPTSPKSFLRSLCGSAVNPNTKNFKNDQTPRLDLSLEKP